MLCVCTRCEVVDGWWGGAGVPDSLGGVALVYQMYGWKVVPGILLCRHAPQACGKKPFPPGIWVSCTLLTPAK